MSLFIGFFPNEELTKRITEISEEVKKIFTGFNIKVRWSNPKTYHMTLLFLGEKISLPKLLYYKLKLKNYSFSKFEVKFNSIKLGISRKYRELIYIDLLEGGDEMRKLYLELKDLLNFKDDINFIPHLTLGRVNKDLSPQEYSNIVKDLSIVSRQVKIKGITLQVNRVDLVRSENGDYTIDFTLDSN